MNDQERELITAFHDGQLDTDAILKARRLIERDPHAATHLESLSRLDDTLRRAFNPILDRPVPDAMQAAVRRAPSRRTSHPWVPMALAASVALVAVLLVRQASVDRQFQGQLAQMQQQIAQLRHQTLENVPSGSKASWVSPVGATRVDVMPVKTYRTTDSRFCREYEERIEDPRGVEIRRGIACRAGKAQWADESLAQSPGVSINGASPSSVKF